MLFERLQRQDCRLIQTICLEFYRVPHSLSIQVRNDADRHRKSLAPGFSLHHFDERTTVAPSRPKSRTISRMAEYLDVTNWSRREVFEFFRDFDKPYFNICTQLDVTNLVALRGRPNFSVFLAYHYFALRMANAVEPFRYRLSSGKVLVHDVIHGAITVLLRNETFTFAYFDYDEDFGKFVSQANRAISEAHSDGAFRSRDTHDAVIHFTTLPWISFTSFSHARNWGREDSVPKIAFGRFTKENDRVLLPMSVEVHHALVDGLHVGRFVNKMEEAVVEPAAYLGL